MEMVNRYSNAGSYRYGVNGQEKSNEVKGEGNSYNAEFWEYDSRIGRRWNLDPKPSVGISEYSTFLDNPILLNDPFGDSSYPTPAGGKIELSRQPETFNGIPVTVANSSRVIQPAAGTVKSFLSGSTRFVAKFNKKDGQFIGYYNASNLDQSFESYISDRRDEAIKAMKEEKAIAYFESIGIWEKNLSEDQAKRHLVGLGIGVSLPNAIFRPAAAGVKAIGSIKISVYRVYGEGSSMYGKSYSLINPKYIPFYRKLAGLPDLNSGQYLLKGSIPLRDIRVGRWFASPLDGNVGGLPIELYQDYNQLGNPVNIILKKTF
jgi:hypothetical protein